MIPLRLSPAGRPERLLANMIDTLALFLLAYVLKSLAGDGGAVLLLDFTVNLAYYTCFTGSRWQATPGKRLVMIYVVHESGGELSLRDALERYLAYVLPSLPLYSSAISEQLAPMLALWLNIFWFSPILFTPERIGIHDRLCGTRVVAGRPGSAP
ncbi:MAG: RDD family protein [Alphaproteobacteria bacterium]